MAQFDVFNGDADGLCALVQLRRQAPCESTLVTGVKRDIALLDRVQAKDGDQVTVLDVSLDSNRGSLLPLLDQGVSVHWFDHHNPGEVPTHPKLTTVIETAAELCTSILVDRHLDGLYRPWAVVGAFGDNLKVSANKLAEKLGLSSQDVSLLERLGECLNYNSYGESSADLHYQPEDLFHRLVKHDHPLEFLAAEPGLFAHLEKAFSEDMAAAANLQPISAHGQTAVFILPAKPWARRVGGVYSNDLCNAHPDRAHAILTEKSEGGYLVSVRAPLSRRTGADVLCCGFPSGGGRAAAAGINHLPEESLAAFMAAFRQQFTI